MAVKTYCIFVVDDDPLLRMLIVDQLQNEYYQIYEFSNGAETLAALRNLHPILIILDIEMPGQNGFELCREIRSIGFDDLQIIFASGHDNLETLLAAYDAGADDFIPKNSKQNLLQSKVKSAITVEKSQYRLKNSFSLNQQTKLSHIGIVIEFLRLLLNCEDLSQLGHLIIETLNQYAVNGLVRLSDAHKNVEYGSKKICTALEKTILEHVSKIGSVIKINDRFVINCPYITLIIMHLNSNNEDEIGSIRDHLIIIAEASSVYLDDLTTNQHLLLENISRTADKIESAHLLNAIESDPNANLIQIRNFIHHQHQQKLTSAFLHRELTENQ